MECHSVRRILATVAVFVGCGMLRGTLADTVLPMLSTDDYVAIQQLYARFNTALDTGQAQQFADTWTDDGEFIGGRGPGRGGECAHRLRGGQSCRLWPSARASARAISSRIWW
jgi:hypothetical protein